MSSLVFCNYVILGGHILNIFKTLFPKLIFHQWLKNQLPDVFFLGILYIFNVCNESLYLKYLQYVFIKNNWWFLLRDTGVGHFSSTKFRFSKKNKFCVLLKVNVFFVSVSVVFPTFDLNLMWIRYFDYFSSEVFECLCFDSLVELKIWNCLEYLLYYGISPYVLGCNLFYKSVIIFCFRSTSWLLERLLERFFIKTFVRFLY